MPINMRPAQAPPIQFPLGAVKLRPIYDNLPVFSSHAHSFKCPALQQLAAQTMNGFL